MASGAIGGYAYGPYVDGPDPLAPPFDLRAALDEIGRDVMEGARRARRCRSCCAAASGSGAAWTS